MPNKPHPSINNPINPNIQKSSANKFRLNDSNSPSGLNLSTRLFITEKSDETNHKKNNAIRKEERTLPLQRL